MPDNVQRQCAYLSESEFKDKFSIYMCLQNCNLCKFRAVGSFFMVGELSKNVGHHGWLTTKNKKKSDLELSPKTKFGQNINDSKYHTWNSFFESIISGIQRFYIRPHISVDNIRVFFNFQISQKKVSFLTLQIFQQTCFCLVSKKHLHCTIS